MSEEIKQSNFETKIDEANKLLEKLIDPLITLNDSVTIYKEGTTLLNDAQKQLDDAKLQFEVISNK